MKRFLLAAALALAGFGCAPTPPVTQEDHAHHAAPSADTAAMNTIEDFYRFSVDGFGAVSQGSPRTFSLFIGDADRKPYRPEDLKTVHEKKFHLLIVRDDMTGYQHLHPVFDGTAWRVTANFSRQGDHYLYADLAPVGEEPVVLRQTLRIGGPTEDPHPPISDEPLWSMADAHRAELSFAGDLSIGTETGFTYDVTVDGKPATDIRPYLGAYGHVVILKHDDPGAFVHAHPSDTGAPRDGEIRFKAVFPSAGRYTLYAQFDLGGEIKTYPFTVDVER